MRQLLISAVMLFLAISANGQYQIKGKVIDENGNPLAGATVFIKSESIGKSTDKSGQFNITGLQKNNYTLEISFIGFQTETLQATTNKEITIKLTPTTISIKEVTVNSLRATNLSGIAFKDVTKEDINKRNFGQDIPYLLALTPSFITTSDTGTGIGYTGFRIRGTDANRTNITVNDVPINDAESHGTFFVNMPDFASSLSSVQVQRGVGTSTNGAAAFGASINMQTEGLNPDAYGEISSTFGSFNTNKNMLKVGTGLLKNKFAFDTRLSNVTSDGYIDRATVDLKSYYFAGGYYGDKTSVKFLTFGGNEKTFQAWNGVDSEIAKTNRTYNELGEYTDNTGATKYYDKQTDNYKQTHYQLHWLQELNSHLNMKTTAHLTRGIGYYEEYKKDCNYVEYGLIPDTIAGSALETTDLVRQKWLDNYFYGLTYALNYNSSIVNASIGGAINRYDGDHYGKVIWVRNANNVDPNQEFYRSNSIKDDANIYVKANTELTDGLFASVDLQYRHIYYKMLGQSDKYDADNNKMLDLNETHTFDFINPKIGLTYKLSNESDVYASYSISNREPNRNNYTEAGADEQPTFETLYDTEAGYRYQSKDFSASANLYFMNYKNQLILTGKISEIGELLTSNIAESYRAGIELSVGTKITDWLKWNGNISLSQNKILNFTEESVDMYITDINTGDWIWIDSKDNKIGTTDIAYSPNITANSIITCNFNQFEFGLYSNYVGKQYFDNTSSKERSLPAYFVNNISAKYTLPLSKIKTIDFQVMVNNLLNTTYSNNAYTWYSCYLDGERNNEYRVYPQAGTNILASISLKF